MSNKLIYLEPDEEITSVINRIRKADETGVILVIPRGGTIGQSIVNLKLLVRNAAALGKYIGLVTSDKVTVNLASQLEIKSFGKVSEAEDAPLKDPVEAKPAAKKAHEEEDLGEAPIGGLKVHTYEKYSDTGGEADTGVVEQPEEDIETEDLDDGIIEEETPVEDIEQTEPEDEIEEEEHEPEESREEIKEERDGAGAEEDSIPIRPMSKKHFKTEGSRKPFFIISAVLVIFALAASYLFIPYAEASLILKTEDITKETAFSADRTKEVIDEKNGIIPATLVDSEKEEKKQFPATGAKDVGEKARGSIAVSNAVSTDNQILPAGTKATSSDGKVFVLEKGLNIPGARLENCRLAGISISCDTVAGTADATVIALENGDQYNIAPSKFTVGRLTGESKAAFTGGVSKDIKFVKEEDLKKAEEDLKNSLTSALKTEISDKAAAAGLKIAEESISQETLLFESSKKADEEAESFEVKMKVKIFSLGFKEAELKDAVIKLVEADLGTDKMLVNRDKSEINYKIASANVNDGVIRLDVSFKGKAGRKIDEGIIKSRIKNKSGQLALGSLEGIEGVRAAELRITPAFFKWTPLLLQRISVKFDYQESE